MATDDWNDLASRWQDQPAPDAAPLRRRVALHRCRHRWGLAAELLGTAVALVMVARAWSAVHTVGLQPWLVAASITVIGWQVGYLAIRRAHRLFDAPSDGVVGLIDAEIRRARYVVVHLWFGVAGGLLLVALAPMLMPTALHARLIPGLAIAGCAFLGYAAVRTWTMTGTIHRLRHERSELMAVRMPSIAD